MIEKGTNWFLGVVGERKDTTQKSDKSYRKNRLPTNLVFSFGNGGDSYSKGKQYDYLIQQKQTMSKLREWKSVLSSLAMCTN